jgi:hypothetical protein
VRQPGVDRTLQTGSRAAELDDRAHGGPVLRTLVRVLIETGHLVPVLYRYDEGLAGGTHDLSTVRDCRPRTTRRALRTVQLWDAADPSHPVLLGTPLTESAVSVEEVVFSPDGQTLASGDGKAMGCQELRPCQHARTAADRPDRNHLLAGVQP